MTINSNHDKKVSVGRGDRAPILGNMVGLGRRYCTGTCLNSRQGIIEVILSNCGVWINDLNETLPFGRLRAG
jgi:hypothetical protein